MNSARYQCHITLAQFGESAQLKLEKAHIGIIGVGGLGSAAALYLTAAGVGKLTLIDGDTVDETNLQRQILYTEKDIGKSKVDVACSTLKDRNNSLVVYPIYEQLSSNNLDILSKVNLILDCTDNFESRFLINGYCISNNRPLVLGACTAYKGQVTTFDFTRPDSACYGCLYPPDPTIKDITPSESGILAPLPGIIGAFQAAEAIKLITGIGMPAIGRIWTFDVFTLTSKFIPFHKDNNCPICMQKR